MNAEFLINKLTELTILYSPKLIAALAVYVVGSWVVKGIALAVKHAIDKRDIDPSLQPFLVGLVNMLLKVMLIISVLSMLGIEMTSFIAVLGAIGLAVGMALSGTLQNFSGGVMILLFKPFKVGDFIDAQGHAGTVSQIQIFNTIYCNKSNLSQYICNERNYLF